VIEFSSRAQNFNRLSVSEFSGNLPPGTINLSSGSPALGLMPIDEFHSSVTKVLRNKQYLSFQYGPAKGCPELIDWITQHHGVDSAQVMITSGSQQSIDLITKIFIDKGDSILVETPTYSGALDTFTWAMADIKSMPDVGVIPNGTFKIAYVEPSYQNPTGRCWTGEQRKLFMKTAQQKNILVVEDAAYADISFEGENISLRNIDPTRVVYLGSFSKILNPGIRLSYIIAEPYIIDKLIAVKKITDMTTSYFLQLVVADLLSKLDFDQHILNLKRSYRKKRDLLIDALSRHCPEIKFNTPNGGIFLWATSQTSSEVLRERALTNGVSIVPGKEFYAHDPDLFSFRLSYSRITDKDADISALALKNSMG
jgi:DNA-binding transcriptional MocR family regulator